MEEVEAHLFDVKSTHRDALQSEAGSIFIAILVEGCQKICWIFFPNH